MIPANAIAPGPTMPVLDHGYVRLVEAWGSEESIIAAARMSTGKGFQGWGPRHRLTCATGAGPTGGEPQPLTCNCPFDEPGDEKLLAYLWRNQHATPFEMAGFVVEVKAPIFVFREWHRHRTQSYNEMSARYTPLPDENYVPTVERLMLNAGANKQAAGTGAALTVEQATQVRELIANHYALAEQDYQCALRCGTPKELARLVLPVARYSRMRASANLRNWFAFLTLRLAPNAQWEIRQYADAVATIVRERFPRAWSLFAESAGR